MNRGGELVSEDIDLSSQSETKRLRGTIQRRKSASAGVDFRGIHQVGYKSPQQT